MGKKSYNVTKLLFQKVAFNPNLRQFFSLNFRQKDTDYEIKFHYQPSYNAKTLYLLSILCLKPLQLQ